MKERLPIDSHRLWQEGPLLIFENRGDFTLAQAQQATAVYEEVLKAEGLLLLLLDLTDSGSVDPETRRHLVQWGRLHADQICIATVGGGIVFRTTFTLIMSAVRMLAGSPIRTKACAGRSLAVEWLTQQRHVHDDQQLRNQAPPAS